MQHSSTDGGPDAIIRTVRLGRLSWGVALAFSLALSLNAFTLVGWLISSVDAPLPAAYLLSLVLFISLALTYAERVMALRGRTPSGILGLLPAEGSDLRTFAGGWLLLLGYVSLAALLGRGLGQYLSLLAQDWFGLMLDPRWLALPLLLLALPSPLTGAAVIGSLRTKLVYGSLAVVLIFVGWPWLNPGEITVSAAKEASSLWTVVAFLAPGLWSIGLLLGYRERMRHPRRAWLPALLAPIILGGLLGAAVSGVAAYPHLWAASLGSPARLTAQLEPAFLEILLVVVALFVTFVALVGVLTRGLHLLSDLAARGFLPGGRAASGAPIVVGCLLAAAIVFLPSSMVIGLAALGFLWVTALLNGPDVFQSAGRSVRRGLFRLPFHPLFPGLAAAIGIFVPLALPLPVLIGGGAWLLLGGLYFFAFARRHSVAAREERSTFRHAELDEAESDYHVMVAVTDPYTAGPLIQAGARLAQARAGRLTVLQVLVQSEQLPEKMKQFQAQEQLETIQGYLRRADIEPGLPVVPFVRVAEEVCPGIVDSVREENVDLLLLAWPETTRREVLDRVWERVSGQPGGADEKEKATEQTCRLGPLLDAAVHTVPCDVLILRGHLPATVSRVMVPVTEGFQVDSAINLARMLVADTGGQVAALRIVPDKAAASPPLPALDEAHGIEVGVVQASSDKAGILRESLAYDALVMSASQPSLLERGFFSDLALEVARARRQTTLLLRPTEKAYRLWLYRSWDSLTGAFSALTPEERAAVSAQMREAARPSINFFVLITLAATIATLGLLQNSTAIIIGAMLVAPLMSPIASMAMGIVEGDVRLMQVAAEAVIKGVALAVSVAVAITLIAPDPQGLGEILGRTRPVLLDLGVALASGAAAGYALSRKEVGAALPGVAIAVALVPPLCVVGYGLATADLVIAGGAFLLFSTNVIAIILAAAAVFLLMGFRPLPAQQEHFRRGLLVSVVSLLLIAIPLAVLLNVSLGRHEKAELQKEVEKLLREATPAEAAQLVDVALEPAVEGYFVQATVHDFGGFGDDEVDRLERMLNSKLERPMTLQVIVLEARRSGRER